MPASPDQSATLHFILTFKDEPFLKRLRICLILLLGGQVGETISTTRQFLEEGLHKLDVEAVL